MAVDLALVLAWAIVLIDNARRARRDRAARDALGPVVAGGSAPAVGTRLAVAGVIVIGGATLEGLTGGAAMRHPLAVAAGLTLVGGGVGVHLWARRTLGALWATEVAVRERHVLVQGGPYGLVRHPLYLAILMMALGTALAHPSAATGCLLAGLAGGTLLKATAEDRLLGSQLGEVHAAYRARVPALLPRLGDVARALSSGSRA